MIDDLGERLQRLPAEKRKALLEQLRQRGVELPITMAPFLREEEPPLAENQRRIWLLKQLQPEGDSAYHLPQIVHLRGRLDLDALREAVTIVARRHESLRTTIGVDSKGEPVQLIAEEPSIDLQVREAGAVETSGIGALSDELYAFAFQPFDFQESLFRARLYRVSEEDHVFALVFHHIISDGWSLRIFVGEMISAYEGLVKGSALEAPGVPVQFGDYVSWASHRDYASDVEFWANELDGFEPLHFPTFTEPNIRTAEDIRFVFSKTLVKQVRALAGSQGCTLFTVLVAAFELALSLYSGQSDVAIGATVAGREHAEIEQVIGYFSTAIVLRTRFDFDSTVEELLRSVRETTLSALQHHRHLPYEDLAARLALPRNPWGGNPFFNTMVVFQNLQESSVEMADLSVELVDSHVLFEDRERPAMFDLYLEIEDGAEELHATLTFRRGAIDRERATRLVQVTQTLLEQFASNPQRRLGQLSILSAEETRSLVTLGKGPRADFEALPIPRLFERAVEKYADSIAIRTEGGEWTYSRLHQQSNGIARRLAGGGIGVGDRVGVSLRRSPELIAALLGVMKVGAAYVPLEPELPTGRLKYIVANAGLRWVVASEDVEWVEGSDVECIDVHCAPAAEFDVPADLSAEHPAYVIYTSGSTGNPKGVVVSHRNVHNHLHSKAVLCEAHPGEVALCRSSFSFDASVSEIFVPLTQGGTLVVAKPEGHRDPRYLVQLIRDHEVEVMEAVPSGLSLLLETEGIGECTTLKKVILGGEALSAELRDSFLDRLPCRLFNPYGPTEATVETTMAECRRGDQLVSIGRPMHNYQVAILDRFGNMLPAHWVGELCIAGEGVASGYVGEPRKTAESFLPASFSEHCGARMYSSGDNVWWTEEDRLAYLGRRDHQVQVRGIRVEIGEIETLLHAVAGVHEAVVVPVDLRNGRSDGLVAYVVRK